MKIVQLITRMDMIGDIQNHIAMISSQLKKDGHEVILVTGKYKEELWDFKQRNIQVLQIPSLQTEFNLIKDLQALIHLNRLLRLLKPNILAIHSTKAGMMGRLAAFKLGIKSIFTAHSWSFSKRVSSTNRFVLRQMERLLGLLCTKIIAVCEHDRINAIKRKLVKSKKIVTIHHGIKELNQPIACSQSCSNDTMIKVVANVEEPKKQVLLLEALKDNHYLNWKIYFIGQEQYCPMIAKQVKKYNLDSRVCFVEGTINVENLLAQSDIFISLSTLESTQITILEAMRAGLPVISLDNGSNKEFIKDSESGFLIPQDDMGKLCKAIEKLMKNQSLIKLMGDQGNRRFLRCFTFKTMYTKTLIQYKLAVQSNGR